MEGVDVQGIVQQAIQEYLSRVEDKREPAYKAELLEEKKRREQLERRLNELIAENSKSKQIAEEAERNSAIKSELHKLGVAKVDLAYKAVRDGIVRTEDGRIVARQEGGSEVPVADYLASFVKENPEFLPARIAGGTGMTGMRAPAAGREPVDLERIRPGMSAEEMQRVREEIVRVASQSLRGA